MSNQKRKQGESGNDSTPNADKTQQSVAVPNKDVIKLKDVGNIEYDVDEVKRFISTVFHSLEDDENIIGWSPKTNMPIYPKHMDKVFKQLSMTNLPKAFYFGTSTVVPHEDGKFYNRKSLFDRLHVIVLDDIGTKIPEASLPPELKPNYIIETSEGNYQYGFILDEPIDDLELADALIHLVYTSGYSDSGGKMPTKVVRLPCGVNGKKDPEKYGFRVNLKHLDNDYWSPKELLEVLDVGVDWDDVLKDADAARSGRTALMTGTSQWSELKAVSPCLNGTIDPMLEWLYAQDLVISDNGEWVTIECPWGIEHSDGNKAAGYKPVGRGNNTQARAFHCFHDSCAANHTSDFLQHCASNGAPKVPIIDYVADLVADYAFIASENAAYKIRGVRKPQGVKMEAFRNLHPRKVGVYNSDGNIQQVPEASLWLNAPNRLSLQSLLYAPDQPYTVVDYDGGKHLNIFSAPEWGKGSYINDDVEKFLDFLEYLIPEPSERDYFIQWLAAKAQKFTFKGAAILMVAPTQGTGRTTLTDMIATLFNPENVSKVTFNQLCGVTGATAYNEWLESLIVTCDEVVAEGKNRFSVYETMKELFDPRPKRVMINPKYGRQRFTNVYTSYIMLTNHDDAIGKLGDDRRVYVIQNPDVRESPAYFVRLNDWLAKKSPDGTPKWAVSVWRYLQTIEPDFEKLNAPVEMTKGKREMIVNTRSEIDMFIEAITTVSEGLVPMSVLKDIFTDVMASRGLDVTNALLTGLESAIRKVSVSTEGRIRINGRLARIRVTREHARRIAGNMFSTTEGKEMLRDNVVAATDRIRTAFEDHHTLVNKINDIMDDIE